MTGRETLMLVSSRRAGEWVVESTREFGWTGEALYMAAGDEGGEYREALGDLDI